MPTTSQNQYEDDVPMYGCRSYCPNHHPIFTAAGITVLYCDKKGCDYTSKDLNQFLHFCPNSHVLP